jgi:hypothetical protein
LRKAEKLHRAVSGDYGGWELAGIWFFIRNLLQYDGSVTVCIFMVQD